MSILSGLFENFLGGLGKKAAQWIPSKEAVIRGKIAKYEKRLKEIEQQTWTDALSREHTSVSAKLQAEQESLDRLLATKD